MQNNAHLLFFTFIFLCGEGQPPAEHIRHTVEEASCLLLRVMVAPSGGPRPEGFEQLPRILICSPSNVAINNVLERLLQTPGLEGSIVRIGGPPPACALPHLSRCLPRFLF